MAPKGQAKQQPKAQAQPKADSQQAKAKAKPEAPKPTAPAAEPKVEAKAKAKADAKAKAKSEPQAAAAKSAPAAQAKGKAQAAPQQPASQPAKGKAQPKPKAKEPELPPPVVEEAGKKKKTNHRGGRNKNKEDPSAFDEEEVQAQPKPYQGKAAAAIAAAAAEKDPELAALRSRFDAVPGLSGETGGPAGDRAARKKEAEAILKDIEAEMENKKAKRVKCSSETLMQQLDELAQLKESEKVGLVEDTKSKLAEAKAFELWTALKDRLTELQVQCESYLKAQSAPQQAQAPKGGPRGEAGAKAPVRDEAAQREAAALRRLGGMHKKDATGDKVETKSFELDINITKYLFTAPYNFSSRFEQQHKCIVEGPRQAKGAGKGSKGAAAVPSREVNISGLSADDVSACEKSLRALDFSGTKSRDLDNGIVMPSASAKAAIEKEFDVIIFKSQATVYIFGAGKKAESALAKIEDEGFSKSLTVSADLVKMIFAAKLPDAWRKAHDGVNIQIRQPPEADGKSQPAKITVSGKSKKDTEDAFAKVEDFASNTSTEALTVGSSTLDLFFAKRNDHWVTKKFRDIQEASQRQSVSIRKKEGGITLIGPKSSLSKIKADLKDLEKKSDMEPTKVRLENEQVRAFSKDSLEKIRKESGLLALQKDSSEKAEGGEGRVDVLVLLGDDAAVAKAKSAIDEHLKKDGAVGTIKLDESVCRELLVNKGAKIQELQNKHSVRINVPKKDSKEPGNVRITGSEAGVEAAKQDLEALSKKSDNAATKQLTLEEGQIGRVIGRKGETLNKIRADCHVKVDIAKDKPVVTIKGDPKDIEKAEKMIQDVLTRENKPAEEAKEAKAAPAPAAKAVAEAPKANKPTPKAKAKGYEGNAAEDFPTLAGAATSKPGAKAWGKTTKDEESEEAA